MCHTIFKSSAFSSLSQSEVTCRPGPDGRLSPTRQSNRSRIYPALSVIGMYQGKTRVWSLDRTLCKVDGEGGFKFKKLFDLKFELEIV